MYGQQVLLDIVGIILIRSWELLEKKNCGGQAQGLVNMEGPPKHKFVGTNLVLVKILNLLCAKLPWKKKKRERDVELDLSTKTNLSCKDVLKLLPVQVDSVKAVISQLPSVCEILGKSIEARDDLVAVTKTWFSYPQIAAE